MDICVLARMVLFCAVYSTGKCVSLLGLACILPLIVPDNPFFSFNLCLDVLYRSRWLIHLGIKLKGSLGKEDLAKYTLAAAFRLTLQAQLR